VLVGRKGSDDGGPFPAVIVDFTPAGQLDTSFNGIGYRLERIPGWAATGFNGVAIQPAAGGGYGIVVAGSGDVLNGPGQGLVLRYTSAGQLDPTFGTGGTFITSSVSAFRDVALEPDGSIVAAGTVPYTNPDGTVVNHQMAAAHLGADGAADVSFGTSGTGLALGPLDGGIAYAVAIDPLGRIVLAGSNQAGAASAEFERFTAP
jgi:uncharacterized delta-60 repeat protein